MSHLIKSQIKLNMKIYFRYGMQIKGGIVIEIVDNVYFKVSTEICTKPTILPLGYSDIYDNEYEALENLSDDLNFGYDSCLKRMEELTKQENS